MKREREREDAAVPCVGVGTIPFSLSWIFIPLTLNKNEYAGRCNFFIFVELPAWGGGGVRREILNETSMTLIK